MNLLHLRYFKKVVETKNITHAAKELFITQPALSRAMKHLEEELEVPLFSHQGRNIELTMYAKEFYPYVLKVLGILDDGIDAVNKLTNNIHSSVVLCMEVASVSIPQLVALFQEKLPNIQLSIIQHHVPTDMEGNIFYISSEQKAGFRNIPLFTEPIVLAIPRTNPLASKPVLVKADLEQLPLVMLTEKNMFRKSLENTFREQKLELTISSLTDDPATMRSILKQGLGASFFPKTSWDYAETDPFVLKEIADLPMERTVYLSAADTKDDTLSVLIAETLKNLFQ